MKILSKLLGFRKSKRLDKKTVPKTEIYSGSDGVESFKLADTKQVINSTTQLTRSSIDEMEERKHDLEYQLALTRSIMQENSILPFPFERSVILLRKAKRYDEELEICMYIKAFCQKAEAEWDGQSAMIFRSGKLEKCSARIPKIHDLLAKHPA